MLRNKLVRSDGSIIDSSVIISCEFTEEVNCSTNLSVGDVTAAELAVEILSTDVIQQDEVITYYIIEDDVETKIGVFNAEKPTVATRTTMRFTAYDNIVKTEKNFSDWLRENQSLFPMTLLALVNHACSHCGVALASADIPYAGLSVNAFYADNITCRQILSWAGAIAGRFIRANVNGNIEFAWYKNASHVTVQPYRGETVMVSVIDDGEGNLSITSNDIEMTDDGEGHVELQAKNLTLLTGDTGVTMVANVYLPYFQGRLSYESYSTDPIERVQINHSEDDVGIIYPDDASGNCFTISENMILGVTESANVTLIATSLYEQLKDISYVPFSVTVPRTIQVRAGDIINVVNSNGESFTSYVMKVSVAPDGTTLTSTGDKNYGSRAAVASEQYKNLTGKILSIVKNIDGLIIENKSLDGKVGSLELSTEAFKTHVANTYVTDTEFGKYKNEVSSQFTQSAEDFEMRFTTASTDISNIKGDVEGEQQERTSIIRFTDGNIHLGKSNNQIMLILKNDRISFVRNVKNYPELAYISNNILYITEGEFLTQLRIGKFGFTPGAKGNLSFKKVVD